MISSGVGLAVPNTPAGGRYQAIRDALRWPPAIHARETQYSVCLSKPVQKRTSVHRPNTVGEFLAEKKIGTVLASPWAGAAE